MKISLTGAHGTGKSTLINHPYWKEKFPTYTIQDSISRKYPANWSGKKIQRRINFEYFYTHLITKNLISSRTFYDPWAYSRLTIDKSFMLWYFEICSFIIDYDYIFYLPIEFELADDSFRPLDIEYQKQFDTELKFLFKINRVPYFTIVGTVEERIKQIDDILKFYDRIRIFI